jgi:hypothetical protein
MPKGPAPEWKRRLEPILDHEVQASIDQSNGQHDPDTGWYATLHHTGCDTYKRAQEIKRALYRSARHLKVSLRTDIIRGANGTWTVEFTAVNKAHGKAYIAQQSGGDPSRLAYNPYHRPSKEQ